MCKVCLCPPRLESLFPPALWKSCNQIPLAFKVRSPGLEAYCEAQNLHNNGRTSSVICSPAFGLPTQRVWDLILLWLQPFYHLIVTSTLSLDKKVKVKIAQLCPTLCDPRDYTVCGILQARILEWEAFPFSRGSSQPRDWTQVSCAEGGLFTSWVTIMYVFGHGLSLFGGLQCPPVDACSIASLDFGAFAGGEQCMFFYSIFLNQKPNSAFILFSYSLNPRLLRKDSWENCRMGTGSQALAVLIEKNESIQVRSSAEVRALSLGRWTWRPRKITKEGTDFIVYCVFSHFHKCFYLIFLTTPFSHCTDKETKGQGAFSFSKL